jgi:hypothetical protein
MKKQIIRDLEKILKEKTKFNKDRIFVFVRIIVAVIEMQSVNLKKVSRKLNPKVDQNVNYRRINRFFQFVSIPQEVIAKLITSFIKSKDNWTLTIDRTNWKFGKTYINFLVLGVAYRGMAIPILWTLLENKGGNSNYKNRIDILEKFIKIFQKDKIKILVADREFIGKEWFKWLKDKNIPFAIRVKNSNKAMVKNRERKTEVLFKSLKVGQSKTIYKALMYGYSGLKLVGIKTEKDLIIIATNSNSKKALENYKRRWEIETLFSAMKKRGFNLETTHMTDSKKLSLLFAIVSLAFVFSYMIGIWKNDNVKKIKILNHNRLEKSFFLYGLDHINAMFDRNIYAQTSILTMLQISIFEIDDY